MDKHLLKAKCVEKGYTVTEFIKLLGLTNSSYYRIINNEKNVSLITAYKIQKILELDEDSFNNIFFDKKVSEKNTL